MAPRIQALQIETDKDAPPQPQREFRGAWVATVYNIDWPSKPGLPASEQQRELLRILDEASRLNLNAIILQVRPACDTFYKSALEPWSPYLSGTMGKPPKPYYDPLAFAVEEAHKRCLELHAWFNPFRARVSSSPPVQGNHISLVRPDLIREYGKLLWLDPGEEDVRRHSINAILDVVRRYDIDGVHIDDYFYPYPVKESRQGSFLEFPDEAAWIRNGKGMTREDWRRDNINRFVRELYVAIKQEKNWVKFGVSPFGIWRAGTPSGVEGEHDAYTDNYADSRLWLQEGWLDYFSPQLYWDIDSPQPFSALLDWWSRQISLSHERHLWPGVATDWIMNKKLRKKRPATEILNQIDLIRRNVRGDGHIHWNMSALLANRDGIATRLAQGPLHEPALIPESPWLTSSPAPEPVLQVCPGENGDLTVDWRPSKNEAEPAQWVLQVRTRVEGWTTRLLPGFKRQATFRHQAETIKSIAIRAVNRAGSLGPVAIQQP